MAGQIIESLNDIRVRLGDTRLDVKALEILTNNIRQYSGDVSEMEREILKFEISLLADMIS
jgi:hypothetical protein